MKRTALPATVLVISTCFVSQPSWADHKLSAVEAKALFSGKTFDG
jgi:hypothetical protein